MAATRDARRAGQLSLDVKAHPALERKAADGEPVYLQAELEAKVLVPVDRDYNPGDQFVVTIADAHGEAVGRAYVELAGKGAVRFDTLEDKDLGVIGTLRHHKATQTEA
jgi:hypothetical protein